MVTAHRLRRIKTCANCSHSVSTHGYDPAKPRSGPQQCKVPGCSCREFRRPEPGERSRHTANRGLYHGIGLNEDDLVIHEDHRGRYRVDLITSATGNHHDVTGRPLSSIAAAAAYARKQQHTRGIKGTIWVQRGNRYVDFDSDYVANGEELDSFREGINDGLTYASALESKLKPNTQRLDPFTRGFFEAALYSSNDESRDDGGDPLDENYSISDIDPASIAGLTKECAEFQEQNAADLQAVYDAWGPKQDSEEEAGRDFWFTRCGHGVGYWDGDYPEPQATRLDEASRVFGNVDLYVGDDDIIYASGFEPPLTPNARSKKTAEARSPRADVRGATRTEVRSPTRTEVRSPTRTSTYANTRGNFTSTVTGGAGAGETSVTINIPGGDPRARSPAESVQVSEDDLDYSQDDLEPNGRTSTVDEHAARELSLYIENEYALVGAENCMGKSIDKMLKRKLASGKYDSALAPKAWQHLIDSGAARYSAKIHGPVFSAATRRAVAVEFAKAWEAENLRGHTANHAAVPSYELTYLDGDHIETFGSREAALAKAAAVLGVRPVEGAVFREGDGHDCVCLYMSRAHRDAGEKGAGDGGLMLHMFPDSEPEHARNSANHVTVIDDDDLEALTPPMREAWGGYTYKMTYETWDEEALEAGDTDDKGWEEEGSEPYKMLSDVTRATRDKGWVEWSSSHPRGEHDWLISEDDEDMRTGDRTVYNLWIERVDGAPLDAEEMRFINRSFGIRR